MTKQHNIPILADAVMGIDPSLTGFAISIGLLNGETWTRTIKTAPAETLRQKAERNRQIVEPTIEAVAKYRPAIVVIEMTAYSYGDGKRSSGVNDRIGLVHVLQDRLLDFDCLVVECAANTLKAFAAEYGLADKLDVKEALERTYKVKLASYDESDSFGLMKLGQCCIGHAVPVSVKQHKMVDACRLRWGIGRTVAA